MRYALKFSKTGDIKYTSHLDMIRLFKRLFKRTGIKLQYSHGFNPHPKMSFAQPLSLGYSSMAEILEFETYEDIEPAEISERLSALMPAGIEILGCIRLADEGKTLAAITEYATYIIKIPVDAAFCAERDIESLSKNFLAQSEIIVQKPQKKTKALRDVDIKSMIKELRLTMVDGNIIMFTKLDAGSNSNLSPELLLKAFQGFAGIDTDRSDIDVERRELFFTKPLRF